MKISAFKECRELNLGFFECPSTLFLMTGFITILLIFTTFLIARNFYSDEIVFCLSAFIAFIMLVISYFVHNGTAKVALSKKKLQATNSQLREAIQKLKEAEQMQQDFTHMMVHDLRSPLSGVRMVSDLVLKDLKGENKDQWQEPLLLIKNNTAHMLSIVNDLLDLSKIEAGMFKLEKEEVDFTDFINDIIKYFNRVTESKKIKLSLLTEKSIPKIFIDKRAMKQVFENLISNSIKFTGDGGRIEIGVFKHSSTNDINQEAKNIGLHWKLKGGDDKLNTLKESLVVAVTDNGIGISLKGLSRLFNKFEQMKSARSTREKGTGLGLVIVKGIVEAHGGVIGVATKEGEGSTFYFNLPYK